MLNSCFAASYLQTRKYHVLVLGVPNVVASTFPPVVPQLNIFPEIPPNLNIYSREALDLDIMLISELFVVRYTQDDRVKSCPVPIDNAALSMGTGQDFTLSSWVYLTTNSSEMSIMSKSNASREYIFRFGGISGNIFNCGTTGGNVEATTFGTPSTSTWYFLVCRYDAAKQELSISINNGDPQVAT